METICSSNSSEMSYCKIWEGNRMMAGETCGFRDGFFPVYKVFLFLVYYDFFFNLDVHNGKYQRNFEYIEENRHN